MRHSFLVIFLISLCGTPSFAAGQPIDVPGPAAVTLGAELVQPFTADAPSLVAERSVPVGAVDIKDLEPLRASIAAPQLALGVPTINGQNSFRALTASFVTLTLLDSITTTVALRRGLEEKNPILGPIASNTPALFATKAAMAIGTVFLAKHLWKTHPGASMAVMAVLNVATGFVVASNVRQM